MKIQLIRLTVNTRRTAEVIEFSPGVTFLHGPIGKGKSTVARLVDFCLGGELERTPAIQQEFVSAELLLILGRYTCTLERASDDSQSVRVSWSSSEGELGSVNAPLSPQDVRLIDAEVYNLSDLIFYLCAVTPIKVRRRSRDPESPLVRLSIRDIWWYCYLDQTHLDSSFYRLEDPFRGKKSQDAMRFFTGLHSERLSQLESELFAALDEQRAKREAVLQIRAFMSQFNWGSDLDLMTALNLAEQELRIAEVRRADLEQVRESQTHPTDQLRRELRRLGTELQSMSNAIEESSQSIAEQAALRAELITAKTRANRAEQAGRILEGVAYLRCPECGADISDRPHTHEHCRLCGTTTDEAENLQPLEVEALRRDLNERIDQIADSIQRREREVARMQRQRTNTQETKIALDARLQQELRRYDSAFIESIRTAEREIATLAERIRSLQRLQQMPQAIDALEEEAGALQGRIDLLKSASGAERERLSEADHNIDAIAGEFKRILLAIGFPGMSRDDDVVIDPRNWNPVIVHGEQQWGFWDTGSGGKKTLFNVCYALAIHSVAMSRNMPVPNILVIDSPTKNISDDENPELVRSLYDEIYRLALGADGRRVQFLLIDSDFVSPTGTNEFIERRMAGEPGAPSLIPYYVGP